MTIHVFSLDFDGCLFNRSYIDSHDKDVLAHNAFLLSTITKTDTDKRVCFVGSSRQSQKIDAINSPKKGSCFPAIEAISKYLHAELDPFLLADIYGDLADGESYRKALIALQKGEASYYNTMRSSDSKLHANWVFDETKATILYAQMHKIALQYPEEQIVFNFYDDRGMGPYKNILGHLAIFFSTHRSLVPNNVTLSLNHYNGGPIITTLQTIQGTGFIDKNYRQTVKDMAKQVQAYGCDGDHIPIQVAQLLQPALLKNREPYSKEEVSPSKVSLDDEEFLTPQCSPLTSHSLFSDNNPSESFRLKTNFKPSNTNNNLLGLESPWHYP